MTRITTGMLQRNVLVDLNRNAERLAATQRQMSTGKVLSAASDDPVAASRALRLQAGLDATRQHQANTSDGLSWADATETALSTMTDLVKQARELVVQGGNDALDDTSRRSIATEVDQIIAALKEQANTSLAGTHLFSGVGTTAPAYAPDAPPPASPDDVYKGDAGTIKREIGPGLTVAVNLNADELLGSGADGKLLAVLRGVSAHLRSGDGAALRGGDLTGLDTGTDTLLTKRAQNGALTNRLEGTLSQLSALEEVQVRSLSETEDADMAKVLTDFSIQSASYQAALRAGASIVQSSLLDFLR